MDAIIELAERLGKAIAESPQAKALREAQDALEKDEQVSGWVRSYREQGEKMARLEQENKPIEVEDKQKLRDLADKLAGSDLFKQYTGAQVEYLDLMRKVNQTLQRQLGQAAPVGGQAGDQEP